MVSLRVNTRASAKANVLRHASILAPTVLVANSKITPQELHHLFGGVGVGKGAPALCFFWGPSCVHDARVFFAGHGQIREGFSIFEHRIEPRHVLANQLAFEDKSGLRRLGDDAFDVISTGDQFWNHVAVGIAGKIGTNAFAETGGLADVKDAPLVIFEEVNARLVWKVGRSQIHGHGSCTLALTQKGNPAFQQTQRWV